MRLKPGDSAPTFEFTDVQNNQITLASLSGQKILLTFYRNASCPFCNLRLHRLLQQQEQLQEKGLTLLSVFHDTAADIRQHMKAEHEKFTILPDPEGKLYEQYGIKPSFTGMLRSMVRMRELWETWRQGFMTLPSVLRSSNEPHYIPADFLINENLKIDMAYYGADYGDHVPFEKIYDWLQAGALAPKK